MNTYNLKTVFTFIAVSLMFDIVFSQDNNVLGTVCADASVQQSIPTTGTVKSLIIYVKFQNDYFLEDFYDWPSVINGHDDERPGWTEDMLTKTENGTDFEPSISGYYRNMSFNNFKIYGDVYPQGQNYPKLYKTQLNWEDYKSRYCNDTNIYKFDISTVVWEAITNLDNEIDYSQYDNNQDGYVDELIVWFRFGYFSATDCSGYMDMPF